MIKISYIYQVEPWFSCFMMVAIYQSGSIEEFSFWQDENVSYLGTKPETLNKLAEWQKAELYLRERSKVSLGWRIKMISGKRNTYCQGDVKAHLCSQLPARVVWLWQLLLLWSHTCLCGLCPSHQKSLNSLIISMRMTIPRSFLKYSICA